MSIVVFGSINMDLVVRSPRLPVSGETIIGHDFYTAPGGKGANQAVACARLGATTCMVGRVGNDVFADALLDSLKSNQVVINAVLVDQDHPSGIALIAVDDASENMIIVVPGANGAVGEEDLTRLSCCLDDAKVLLLQLEIPIESVVAAARLAKEREIKVVIDPAPAQKLPPELYHYCDVLTPNEIEAGLLVGFPVRDEDAAISAAKTLVGRGAKQVIIKMGSKGAYWFDGEKGEFFSTYQVEAVDTVAAGDAFNGGLAVGLAEDLPMEEAMLWGMAAGALSTTKRGAQPSMPDRVSVEKMIIGV